MKSLLNRCCSQASLLIVPLALCRGGSTRVHMSRSDEIPKLVTLPVGSYIVEARSENNGYVRVRVVINPAQRTMLELDRKV